MTAIRIAIAATLLAAVAGCSKPSGGPGGLSSAPASAASLAPPPAQASSAPSEAASATPSQGLVLTPEDAEDAAEHRITEQNLESELDRLEREIQAE